MQKKDKLWVKITALIIALAFAASTAFVAVEALLDNLSGNSRKKPPATRPAAAKPASSRPVPK